MILEIKNEQENNPVSFSFVWEKLSKAVNRTFLYVN